MATQTITTTTHTFKDIDLSFAMNPTTKDIGVKTNQNAVKNAVRNLVLGNNFEVPFHPEQGCQAAAMLFELATPITAEIIRTTVIQVLEKYEPRIQLNDVTVSISPDEHVYNVNIFFMVIGYTTPTTVSIVLERTR
jgi:uncharacterized protein